ncbi:hypothetical protein U1Q18_051319, partial [Sarracenia purpurea var. burkii]
MKKKATVIKTSTLFSLNLVYSYSSRIRSERDSTLGRKRTTGGSGWLEDEKYIELSFENPKAWHVSPGKLQGYST